MSNEKDEINQPEKDHLSPADRVRVSELKALLRGTPMERELHALFGLDTPPPPPPPEKAEGQ